jgi:hypothetical protein
MNNYKRYAELKAQEAELKAELSELSQVILKDMKGAVRDANGYGLFSKVVRRTFKYSDRLVEREAEAKKVIKLAKEREERNGAKFTDSVSLRYKK